MNRENKPRYRLSYGIHGPYSERMAWKEAVKEFKKRGGEYIVDCDAEMHEKKVYHPRDIEQDEKAFVFFILLIIVGFVIFWLIP